MRQLRARRWAGAVLPGLIAALGLAATGCGPDHARPAHHPKPSVSPMLGAPGGEPQPALSTGNGGTTVTGLQAGRQRAWSRPTGSTGQAAAR